MNAAEILFEAYDLLPVIEEREFLRLVFKRCNLDALYKAIDEGQDDKEIEGFLSLFLTSGDVEELGAIKVIIDERWQRKAEKRAAKRKAEARKDTLKRLRSTIKNSPYDWQVSAAKEQLSEMEKA